MKKYNLLILILLTLLISGVNGCPKKEIGTEITEPSGSEVLVEFIRGKPPAEIDENDDFVVGLKFLNYNDEPITVNLELWAITDLEGFDDTEESITIEAASVDERGNLLEPGDEIKDYSGKYENVEGIENVQFEADINYDIESKINVQFCTDEPDSKYCWPNVDLTAGRNPVTITDVKKEIISLADTDEIKLTLDIYIENVGGGNAGGKVDTGEDAILTFDLLQFGESVDFTCKPEKEARPEDADEYLQIPFDFILEESKLLEMKKRPTIKCKANVDPGLKYHNLDIYLDYPYRSFNSKTIEVKG